MMWRSGADSVWAQQKYELRSGMGEIVRRMGEVIKPVRRYAYYALLTIFMSSALQMIPPVATKYVIDILIPTANVKLIIALAIGLMMLHLARFGLLYLSRY